MFEQHKLAHEYGMWGVMGATNLGRSTLVMAHELAHSMGVGHDGKGENQDCDGEYHRGNCKLSPHGALNMPKA